jgi:hypothetical protein
LVFQEETVESMEPLVLLGFQWTEHPPGIARSVRRNI